VKWLLRRPATGGAMRRAQNADRMPSFPRIITAGVYITGVILPMQYIDHAPEKPHLTIRLPSGEIIPPSPIFLFRGETARAA
jgi:hypothetical protein